jgi:hypothetical protein
MTLTAAVTVSITTVITTLVPVATATATPWVVVVSLTMSVVGRLCRLHCSDPF